MIVEFSGKEFWKNYMHIWFGKELIDKWYKYAEVQQIDSVRGKIHVEVYRNEDPTKPTLVFSHGIAGYARVLLPFIVPLFEKGYNIIAPDLEGFGYNERKKGDFCWDEHLINLRDTVEYARANFKGKVYLGGGSMGGPLAYATDARYNCADGLVCWCLWDFRDKEFVRATSTTGRVTPVFIPLLKLASILFGRLTIHTTRIVPYRDLTTDPNFNTMLLQDPHSGNTISLRGALSLFIQAKPDLAHELYEKPVLVCQPKDDKMTEARFTKRIFDKLGSERKRYVDFTGGHYPLEKSTYIKWAEAVDKFIKENE